MNCKNCGTLLHGDFCSQCGQHSRVGKLNFSSFVKEVSETIFQVDRGFFKTLIDLFWRPGYAIRDYLEGKRKAYYKPLAYALTLSTIYFIISQFLDTKTFLGEFISGFNAGFREDIKGDFEIDSNWVADNYAIINIILIPLYGLGAFIAFLGKGYNYLEHIAIRSFVVGQQAIIYLFFSVLIFLFGKNDVLESIPAFFAIIYVFWVNVQLYKPNKIWNTLFRTAGFYFLLGILGFVLTFIALVLMVVLGESTFN